MNKNTAKLIILIGNIAAIIGCFMPFMAVWGFSVDYFEGDGAIVVGLSVVAIIIALIKPKFAFIPNALSLFIPIYDISQMDSFSRQFLDTGAYVVIIGTAVAIIASIIALVKKL